MFLSTNPGRGLSLYLVLLKGNQNFVTSTILGTDLQEKNRLHDEVLLFVMKSFFLLSVMKSFLLLEKRRLHDANGTVVVVPSDCRVMYMIPDFTYP